MKTKIPIYYIKTDDGYYCGEDSCDYTISNVTNVQYFDAGRSSSFFGYSGSGYSGVSRYIFDKDKSKAISCVISGLGEVITQIAYRQNKGFIPKSNIEIIREEK